MSKLERITVTMPTEMAAKMRAAVEKGEYATTSEIVREALREWSDYQKQREDKLRWLRSEIKKGEESPMLDGEQVLDELQNYVRDLVAQKSDNRAA